MKNHPLIAAALSATVLALVPASAATAFASRELGMTFSQTVTPGTGDLTIWNLTDGIDKVTVALPANLAASGKLFARLSVVLAEP